MSKLLDYLAEHVLLLDGAMGTATHARDLDIERDYDGQENCTEILTRTRPDVVRDIHRGYFEAGADAVETNTFGGSPITLAEFGLGDEAHDLNRRACELAREAIDDMAADGRPRFVFGSIGPGTKLPSLGHIDYAPLEDAYAVQAGGLVAGGADAFLIETCQDPLQIKAAVNGAKRAREAAGAATPIFVQVTVETTGTLLVGSDIAAAATIVDALDVDALGLNCATGPREMAEHLAWLAESWSKPISLLPNAGLPELVDGATVYPLGAAEMAEWLARFVVEDGVNIIGGCCGTTPAHIAALDAMLRGLGDARRPAPKRRQTQWAPATASLYGQVPYAQENAFFSIGERCNANGSRAFRALQEARDWEACVAMGRAQLAEGSHALDVCTAFVGRDEVADMTEIVSRMRGAMTAPLVIDSTEYPVLERALSLYGGKAIVNSINFEDGEETAAAKLALARRFGAAVIALTIDEEGMARDAEAKLAIARRLHDFACGRHGLPAADLLIDPLTFTICTGNDDDRGLGLATLDAIERITTELPECQVILGLSNISFGLKPAARHVLNSVFLDHALRRGMTGSIVHVSKIKPLHAIPEAEVAAAEDLIFDRRRPGHDPLQAFIALYVDRAEEAAKAVERPARVEDRLARRIVDGDRQGLEADLDEALAAYPPLDIVNRFLLDGMKVVGDLFGAGKMQLPFVLQSAETMKAAVAYLEPHMDRADTGDKGTIVLATVKGDVHDIGKNLVDIILTNNGYKVVNLGIKQPLSAIVDAARACDADAIGMSGLLVKSASIMRENLAEMSRQAFDVPVFLGGAALTRKYVEEDCRAVYDCGRVAYARDAFDGMTLMKKVIGGDFDAHVAGAAETRDKRPSNKRRATKRADPGATSTVTRPVDLAEIRVRRRELARDVTPPEPPFVGPRVVERVPVAALLPYLNETMLFQFHWGFKRKGRRGDAYRDWAEREVRPILKRLLEIDAEEEILLPQAAYGFWPAASEGNDLIVFDSDGETPRARFTLPRQDKPDGLSIADFFRDVDDPRRDVIGLQVVTVGQRAADVAREWFANDRYRDYLFLHGLGVELAEALAEYVHQRIRAELGLAAEDAREIEKMLKQGYRGARYSFGYPACPNLADQRQILELLGAERIGVDLGDEDQLHPEQSTSAIVVHHPQARYFSV